MRKFAAIVLIGSLALGVVLQGSFLGTGLTLIGLQFILIPAAFVLVMFAAVQWLRGRLTASSLGRAALVWSVLAYGAYIYISWIAQRFTFSYDINVWRLELAAAFRGEPFSSFYLAQVGLELIVAPLHSFSPCSAPFNA